MTTAEILAKEIGATRDWTLKLLADLDGDDWGYQPAPGLAHPLWICGHLACAQHLLIHVRCLERGVLEDDFIAHFSIGGPVLSTSEHAYPSVQSVRDRMAEVHDKTGRAIRSMSDALLDEPAFGQDGSEHPHYRTKLGAVQHASRHEAFHSGQIALIRRLLGKPFLR